MQHKVPFLLMLLTLSLRISIANADECTGNGGSKFGYPIVVDKSGENHQWVKVQINPDVYMEKVTIPKQKPCIFLEGQDKNESATFTSMVDNIVAKGITFKNSYNHPLLLKHALIAAKILGDKSAFFKCGFLGLQDTLWDASGRHYFAKCHIEAAADFIFGSGQSIYHACKINVTAGALSSQYPYGYITAQGQGSSDDTSGFVFKGGTLFGNVHVVPQGWDAWKFPGKEYNFMYAEVNCKGPGFITSNRVT
uniref:pectinesterase n=1 Tax=Gossypium raimondii TaxID=29730 RepID=A0A0D2W5K4_GOSRA|nr:hypothetical protein B456_013G129900 [Gossypium raimondii]